MKTEQDAYILVQDARVGCFADASIGYLNELRLELLKWVDSIDAKLAQMHQEMEYTEECMQETYRID